MHPDGTPATNGSTFPGNHGYRITGLPPYLLEIQVPDSGTFSFRMVTVKQSQYDIQIGDGVSGSIGAAGQLDIYVLDPAGATSARIEPGPSCAFALGVTEQSPEPHISSPSSTCLETKLSDLKPGVRYLILVWAESTATGQYGFRVVPG